MAERPARMTAEQALSWVVDFQHIDFASLSETARTQWQRQFETFSTVLIDGWPEQPARFSWKGQRGSAPRATKDELETFHEYVEHALTRATTPDSSYLFPVKYGASENYQLFCNPDEDDYPTTCYRMDAAMLLLKSLLRWNRGVKLLRECPEWNQDQRLVRVKCRRFFLIENRSHQKYCQDACDNRANQRNKRKGA